MDIEKKLAELLGSMCCSDLGIDGCDNCKYRYEENCNAKAFADHLIANGVTVQEWIPVTERLPEKHKRVLTVSDNGNIDVDWVDKFGVWIGDIVSFDEVTHWMPMPKPPKGE